MSGLHRLIRQSVEPWKIKVLRWTHGRDPCVVFKVTSMRPVSENNLYSRLISCVMIQARQNVNNRLWGRDGEERKFTVVCL